MANNPPRLGDWYRSFIKIQFNMHIDPNPKDALARTTSDRIGLVVFVILVWTVAAWMFWLVEKFADGNTWWDFAVKVVLHDLVFAIAVFGCALLAHACCPSVMQQIVETAAAKLHVVVWAIIGLVVITLVFVSLVLPVLMHFGIVA